MSDMEIKAFNNQNQKPRPVAWGAGCIARTCPVLSTLIIRRIQGSHSLEVSDLLVSEFHDLALSIPSVLFLESWWNLFCLVLVGQRIQDCSMASVSKGITLEKRSLCESRFGFCHHKGFVSWMSPGEKWIHHAWKSRVENVWISDQSLGL